MRNHTTVMGPKNLPMPAVPRFARQTGRKDDDGQRYHAFLNVGEMTSSPRPPTAPRMAGGDDPSP